MARKKRLSAAATSVDTVALDWKLVKPAFLAALKRFLEGSIGFDPDPRARKTVRYLLRGQHATHAVARETYPVFPFVSRHSEQYWLAVAVDCDRLAVIDESVRAISMIVFEGETSKRPILRAEWDCFDAAYATNHAQPHWHIYTGTDGTNDERLDPQDPSSKTNNESSAEYTVPIHFAMSARWHFESGKSHQQRLTNDGQVRQWVTGCLEYVKSELEP
jgi:hypothetical protein